jgi:cytoskeleton protein RodZ
MMEQTPGMDQLPDSDAESGKFAMTPLEIGIVLREARESSGMSVNDVATRLKFAPRQITALEQGDLASLHGMTFIRGFVRSYARLLQLDEEPLLDALPSASASKSPSEKKDEGVPFPGVYAARKSNILWLVSTLIVAVALGIFIWQRDKGQPESQVEVKEAKAPVIASAVSETLPVSAPAVSAATEAKAETRPESVKETGLTQKPAVAPVATGAKAETRPESMKETGLTQKPVVAPETETENEQKWKFAPLLTIKPESAVQGADMLRIACDEDSWLEVRNGNGTVLLSQICQGGDERILNRAPPYSVAVGNAKGVRLYFRGQQIDLAPYTRIDVARLRLE